MGWYLAGLCCLALVHAKVRYLHKSATYMMYVAGYTNSLIHHIYSTYNLLQSFSGGQPPGQDWKQECNDDESLSGFKLTPAGNSPVLKFKGYCKKIGTDDSAVVSYAASHLPHTTVE